MAEKDFVTVQLRLPWLRCTNCQKVFPKAEYDQALDKRLVQCCLHQDLQPWEWPRTAFTGVFKVD